MKLKSLRNAFFSGIVLLLPITLTFFVLNFLIQKVGTPTSDLFFGFIDSPLRSLLVVDVFLKLVSILIVFIAVAVFGYFSSYFLGKMLWSWAEKAIASLPFVNTVYDTIKQIVRTFSEQSKATFQQVVLVPFFNQQGVYGLGFITNTQPTAISVALGPQEPVVHVFVPTTPNPTSGFLMVVRKKDVILLDMTVGEAMKMVLSGGALSKPTQGSNPLPAAASTGTKA
jgi:uncharacterized membrane protein